MEFLQILFLVFQDFVNKQYIGSIIKEHTNNNLYQDCMNFVFHLAYQIAPNDDVKIYRCHIKLNIVTTFE